jgi:ribosomal protein S7
LMKNGNQSVAKKILYNACMFAGSKTATAPPQKTEIAAYSAQRTPPRTKTKTKTETRSPFAGVLVQAVHNARPLIECSQGLDTNRTSRRPPSKAKPVPITSERANRLAIQWIIEGASKRPEKTMALRLSLALVDAYQGKGYAIKKREELHNACKAWKKKDFS